MSKYVDVKLQRVNLIFEPSKDAAVVDLDVVLKITSCETAAEQITNERDIAQNWQGQGTVLLVDDEAMVRQVAASMLKFIGFDVLEAADGHEAVEVFRAHQEDILLVLLDMTMPRMSGEEAFDEIRKIKPDALVMLSSGYT